MELLAQVPINDHRSPVQVHKSRPNAIVFEILDYLPILILKVNAEGSAQSNARTRTYIVIRHVESKIPYLEVFSVN